MACRECPGCSRRFPAGITSVVCIFCDEKLTYNTTGQATVEKKEWDEQAYIRGRKIPKSLSAEEAIQVERDWEALAVERGRRGTDFWSEADLIAEAKLWPESVRPGA